MLSFCREEGKKDLYHMLSLDAVSLLLHLEMNLMSYCVNKGTETLILFVVENGKVFQIKV